MAGDVQHSARCRKTENQAYVNLLPGHPNDNQGLVDQILQELVWRARNISCWHHPGSASLSAGYWNWLIHQGHQPQKCDVIMFLLLKWQPPNPTPHITRHRKCQSKIDILILGIIKLNSKGRVLMTSYSYSYSYSYSQSHSHTYSYSYSCSYNGFIATYYLPWFRRCKLQTPKTGPQRVSSTRSPHLARCRCSCE